MFDQARQGRSWPLAIALFVGVAALALAWIRPDLVSGMAEAVSDRLQGDALVVEGRDRLLSQSPLEVVMRLDGVDAVAADQVRGLSEALAKDAGRWLLRHTDRDDLQSAEVQLWEMGGPDPLLFYIAAQLRARNVYLRKRHRLFDGVADEGPIYAHPDELTWLAADILWRLDLRADLVQSPVHQYLVVRAPGAAGSRTFEVTCFRRVDALGKVVPSDEPSVGRRLVAPEDHYPSGVGGIRHPSPLPNDAYVVLDEARLPEAMALRLAAIHALQERP